MDFATISGTNLPGLTCRPRHLGYGGGWMWGGTDDQESIRTIHAALDQDINLIDTAPVYGFGRAEEIVGKAVAASGHRDKVIIATKVGLEWQDGHVVRNATRARLLRELEDSLRRLQTSYIDPYQSTGPTRSSRWKRPRKPWRSSTGRGKSGPSG